MKILVAHNSYQQRGGEDSVVAAEPELLRTRGHEVVFFRRSNDDLKGINGIGALNASAETVWSFSSHGALRKILKTERPDIAHFHNTFPLISPSAYYACADAGVPVVQTLHNFRLLCPAATLLREGKICEACLGRSVPWPGMLHACYRHSRPATAASAAMLTAHRILGTWDRKVSLYIALTEFARDKFIQGGLPADKIVVKPNFVNSDAAPKIQPGEYALFVGRLVTEKGPQQLPLAWRKLNKAIPLRIAGDGPLLPGLVADVRDSSLSQIQLLGLCSKSDVLSMMVRARFLLFPSLWYESFPVTIAEAFACGLPVIVSRLGSMAEIVQDGVTGLHFEPGNAADLAAKVEWAWGHPEELDRMSKAARAEYEAKYSAERNYGLLMDIYRQAIASKAIRGASKLPTAEAAEI